MNGLASAPGQAPGAFRFASRSWKTAWRRGAAVFALAGAAATGCLRQEPRADLVIVNGPEPESLDPHLVTGQADGRVALALFEGLTRYNVTNAAPEPALARSWDVSPEGSVYTFHLRTNAAWSTGEPITAEDLAWSWRRVLAPETACEYAGILFYVKHGEAFATGKLKDFAQVGIRVLDPHTLRVELEHPTPFFLELCAYPTLAALPRRTIETHGDAWLRARPFVCSGAFTLEDWRLNDKIRLRRNPHYWEAAGTRSAVVDLLPCVTATTALNLYETGAADIVWDKDLVPAELLDVLLARPDFHTYDFLGNYFIRVNVTRAPLADARVRRALAMAIDRRRLVEKITRAGERPAYCLSPPGIANGPLAYEPPAGLAYDPDAARRWLAEAGFPGGRGFPAFTYTYNTQKTHEKIAIELREMWRRELGVNVELRQLEWKTYFRAQSMLEYDLIRSSWIADYNDPNTFLDLFMSDNPNNRTGWRSPAYDRLLRAANAEAQAPRRQALLREAEQIVVEQDLPVIPLYFYVGIEYYDPRRVTGIHANLKAEHPLRAIARAGETTP